MGGLQKVLLMGKSGAGKTSMRSIIFANYLARDTMRLGATIDVEHSHVRFLGNLVLNLWDCGGQEAFMENYFESQRDHIFRNVQVLIYVFDIESRELAKDMEYYASCLQAVKQNSQSAKVFCLVHKMDLIPEEQREEVFAQRERELTGLAQPLGLAIACYKTSIWDETLYRAWSQMVYSLIPNRDHLQSHLEKLCEVCQADELVLFERATFLVISNAVLRPHSDVHRFEKVRRTTARRIAARGTAHRASLTSAFLSLCSPRPIPCLPPPLPPPSSPHTSSPHLLPIPWARAPSPGVQHHQAVQALVLEDVRALQHDAGAQRALLGAH